MDMESHSTRSNTHDVDGARACRYASALLGISNTAGALPGVLGVTLAGVLLDKTNNWATAVFLPIAAIQVFGTIIYTIFGSSERRVDW